MFSFFGNEKLDSLIRKVNSMAHSLDEALVAVRAVKAGVDSIVVLLGQLRQQIQDAAGDPAKIDAIFDAATAEAQAITDAINTSPPTP